jgi:hypothetical protein
MEESEPPLPFSVGVPELPTRWREHYADITYLAGLLSGFLPKSTAQTAEAAPASEPARADFLLGLYAQLTRAFRQFDQDCHSVWLVHSTKDFENVQEGLRRIAEAVYSNRQRAALARVATDVASPEQVASRLVESGHADIVERWHAWLGKPSSEAEEPGSEVLALGCQLIEHALTEALR